MTRTYADSITYDVWNGLARERFGTDTPLYHKERRNVRGQIYDMRLSTVNDADNWNRGAIVNYYNFVNYGFGTSGSDNNGNLLVQQHWIPTDDAISGSSFMQQNYDYDALNRLTWVGEYQNGASATGSQNYSYDRYGNRTISFASGAGINNQQFTVDPDKNQLGVPSGLAGVMQYDAAGNLTHDTYSGAGTRTYDAENRMVSATNSLSQQSGYTYDADGKRVRRSSYGQETWQVYGIEGELVAEYAANTAPASPQKEYGYRNGQLLITAEVTQSQNTQNVTWTNAVGVSTSGNNLTKTAVEGWGNSGAVSTQTITSGDGYVEITVGETNTYRMFGLSYGDSQQNYNDIDFACYPIAGGALYVYEGGVDRGQFGTYSVGDHLRVAVEGGVVKYSKNGVVFYTSTVSPSYPLLVDTAFYSTGATLSNVVMGGGSGGGSQTKINWLVADHLGTPRMIADKTGSLSGISRHDYLPFGEELHAGTGGRTASQGYVGDNVRQKFTGYERDNESGLDYAQARYHLLDGELRERLRKTVELNLQFARFPYLKRLAEFDYAAQPGVDRRLMEELATGRFLYEGRSVVFLGPPGVGKTHLAISLGVLTAEMGHRVYFTTAIEMARKLSKAMAENHLHRELNNMTRPKLLVIDEVGYLQLDTAEASLVFQVISSRYEKGGAIILTSNKAFSEWGDIFAGDAVVASAARDRLLHRCTVINIRGESYRLKEKRQATKSAFTMPVEESQAAVS